MPNLPSDAKMQTIPANLIETYCIPEVQTNEDVRYNKTSHYNLHKILITFGEVYPTEEESQNNLHPNPIAIRALQEYRSRPIKKRSQIFENCSVTWLEWSGTYGNPITIKRTDTNCRIEFLQGKFIIQTATQTFAKREGATGFSWENEDYKYDAYSGIKGNHRIKSEI